MFSYESDTVLDPWLGSGTTVKVARELSREAVGYEKEPQYKSVIMKKLGIESDQALNEAVEMMKESIEKINTEDVETPSKRFRARPKEREATVECADDYLEVGQVA
jgi:DNA modification methylase